MSDTATSALLTPNIILEHGIGEAQTETVTPVRSYVRRKKTERTKLRAQREEAEKPESTPHTHSGHLE